MRDRLPKWMRGLYDFVLEVVREGGENDLSLFAPAMAFSLVVSLAPLTIALNAFTAQAFSAGDLVPNAELDGLQVSAGEFVGGAFDWLGPFATVAAAGLIIFGASRLFRQYGQALERIWRQPGQEDTLWTKVRKHVFSIILLFVAGLTLFLSAIMGSALASVSDFLAVWAQMVGVDLWWLSNIASSRFVLDFVFASVLFAVAYTTVPRIRPHFVDVLPGALMTAAAYAVGQWGLGIYLGNSARIEQLGTFGAFLGFLLWAFYAASIVLWGAQVAHHIAMRRACARGGDDVAPYTCAVREGHEGP
jgi:membrane protein